MRYYVDGFFPVCWEILAWLRRPPRWWGWIVAGALWPVMSTFWLMCQLRYGDDWYVRRT